MSVAFSPDGKYVLTGTRKDGAMHLWDVATGKKVRRFDGCYDWNNSAAFSPDGKYVLTVGINRTAKLWLTANGEFVRDFLHDADVNAVAYAPDGKLVATGSNDRTARLWDPETGQPVGQPLTGHAGAVIALAFSSDGKFLLTGSANTPARLWETGGGTLVRPLDARSRNADLIRFSPDGRFIVTGGPDNIARLWDTASGKQLAQFEEQAAATPAAAFSPNSKFIFTGGSDGALVVSDSTTGQAACRMILFPRRHVGRGGRVGALRRLFPREHRGPALGHQQRADLARPVEGHLLGAGYAHENPRLQQQKRAAPGREGREPDRAFSRCQIHAARARQD